jgi:hypothetical protein
MADSESGQPRVTVDLDNTYVFFKFNVVCKNMLTQLSFLEQEWT